MPDPTLRSTALRNSSTTLPMHAAAHSQLVSVFPSPSGVHWKVVRETRSAENERTCGGATQPVKKLKRNRAEPTEQQLSETVQRRQQIERLEDEVRRQQGELEKLREQLASEQADYAVNQQHLQHMVERLQHQLEEAQQRHAAVLTEAAEHRTQYDVNLQAAQCRLYELRVSQEVEQEAAGRVRRRLTKKNEKLATQLAAVREQLAASQGVARTADDMCDDSDHASDGAATADVSAAHTADVAVTPAAGAAPDPISVSLTALTSSTAQSDEARDTDSPSHPAPPSTLPELSEESTRVSIYRLCTTYEQLRQYEHLRAVQRLQSCISSYNCKHKLNSIRKSFDRHRELVLFPERAYRRCVNGYKRLRRQHRGLRQRYARLLQQHEQLQLQANGNAEMNSVPTSVIGRAGIEQAGDVG